MRPAYISNVWDMLHLQSLNIFLFAVSRSRTNTEIDRTGANLKVTRQISSVYHPRKLFDTFGTPKLMISYIYIYMYIYIYVYIDINSAPATPGLGSKVATTHVGINSIATASSKMVRRHAEVPKLTLMFHGPRASTKHITITQCIQFTPRTCNSNKVFTTFHPNHRGSGK